MRRCLPILVTCWSCGRIANAATGTSTRRPPTCSSAPTNAPGAATARRTSCTASARTAAASSSGAPSARPICWRWTRHRPQGLSGQDAPWHLPADRRKASRRAGRTDLIAWRSIHRQRVSPHRRLHHGFAEVDSPARDRPVAVVGPPDQQHLARGIAPSVHGRHLVRAPTEERSCSSGCNPGTAKGERRDCCARCMLASLHAQPLKIVLAVRRSPRARRGRRTRRTMIPKTCPAVLGTRSSG